MFISSTMSLGARVSLLLVPLVTALDPPAAHATQSGDFAGLVDVGGGRKMYSHRSHSNQIEISRPISTTCSGGRRKNLLT
jgi:hypothetical protein